MLFIVKTVTFFAWHVQLLLIWRTLTLLAFETAFLWPFFHFNIPLLERLGAAFLSKKVEILIFCFLFFFSSSRPLTTFNCQKCTFWFELKELENYLYKNILIFLQWGDLNLVAKLDSFSFFWVFITTLSSNFEMSKC